MEPGYVSEIAQASTVVVGFSGFRRLGFRVYPGRSWLFEVHSTWLEPHCRAPSKPGAKSADYLGIWSPKP